MTIEEQLAEELLRDLDKRGYGITFDGRRVELRRAIEDLVRRERSRASRIVTGAPLDMSLEQLGLLIRNG